MTAVEETATTVLDVPSLLRLGAMAAADDVPVHFLTDPSPGNQRTKSLHTQASPLVTHRAYADLLLENRLGVPAELTYTDTHTHFAQTQRVARTRTRSRSEGGEGRGGWREVTTSLA